MLAMYHAGNATKIAGLSYRQLDHIVRNRRLRPSHTAAQGRGTVRSFTERDLVALRLVKTILDAGYRLGPFMHVVRYVQRGRGLPPIDKFEGKVLVSDGHKVHVVDGARMNVSTMLKARAVLQVVDLGAAARHVHHRIERLEQKSGKHKEKRPHTATA
jgi:DNA-binding transcriptional MerR regulator